MLASKYAEDCTLQISLKKYPLKFGNWEVKSQDLPSLKAKSKQGHKLNFTDYKQEVTFQKEAQLEIKFEIEALIRKTECFCLSYETTKSLGWTSKGIKIEEFEILDSHEKFKFEQKLSGKLSSSLKGKVEILTDNNVPVWKKFDIEAGTYYDCIMPENIESMWGPVPLKKLPDGVDNECKAVTHR